MAAPQPVPAADLMGGQSFPDHVRARPDALVYFLCNVGDGDAQLILLPQSGVPATRQAVVIDAAITGKIPPLLNALEAGGTIPLAAAADDPIALVVATHPHQDHIGGMPELLQAFAGRIAEYWDSGYFHSIPAYHQTMAAVEAQPHLLYAQPTSGLRRWIGDVAISVLSPSVQLRNRYDSYGTEINDSSISLRLEFPVYRYLDREEEGQPVIAPRTRALVLGADAQTTSWAYVLADFPFLRKSDTPAAKAIAAAQGNFDLLRGEVLKVSHHGSKHGVNLELVERVAPKVSLISSVGGGGNYHFPHTVAQDLIREGLDPSTSDGHAHPADYEKEMNVFYTCDEDDQGAALGSVALVMSDDECTFWRFGDGPTKQVDLGAARRWTNDVW